jgi:hypothetical protein
MHIDDRFAVTIYGDFNCPFSALASARASRVEARGEVMVTWRAVEHAPDIPVTGSPIVGALRSELDEDLATIRTMLLPGEDDELARPTRLINTRRAAAAFAGAGFADRPALRRAMFDAYWADDIDLGDPARLAQLGADQPNPSTTLHWQRTWRAVDRPIVPLMVLPDGRVSRGLGVLTRLADLETTANSAPLLDLRRDNMSSNR